MWSLYVCFFMVLILRTLGDCLSLGPYLRTFWGFFLGFLSKSKLKGRLVL